jgi:hypothetical protein
MRGFAAVGAAAGVGEVAAVDEAGLAGVALGAGSR